MILDFKVGETGGGLGDVPRIGGLGDLDREEEDEVLDAFLGLGERYACFWS
jgi:hypothetical protein